MARPLRIDFKDALYHVTARGWERRAIFADDSDRETWVRLLDRIATRCDWVLFSWVLMSNHYHMLIRTPHANLSAGMHDLNSGYATLFNRRHRRTGALFQGRFKAIMVEQESHASQVSRYIHLNPVRAGIVAMPEDHRWSSYSVYRFHEPAAEAPAWLDWKTVVAEYGHTTDQARRAYCKFVEAGIKAPPRPLLNNVVGGMFIGSERWVEERQKELCRAAPLKDVPQQKRARWRPNAESILQVVCDAFDVAPEFLSQSRLHHNDARVAAIYLLRLLTDVKVGQLACDFGGVSSAAISKLISRADARRAEDPEWRNLLDRLKERCTETTHSIQ